MPDLRFCSGGLAMLVCKCQSTHRLRVLPFTNPPNVIYIYIYIHTYIKIKKFGNIIVPFCVHMTAS